MSDVRKELKGWAKRIGQSDASKLLIAEGVSPRAAEKLCAGTYPSEPKALREKLLRALSKAGIHLEGTQAAS